MKAITLQDDAPSNPVCWLSLVEWGIKTIETRSNWMNRSHWGDTILTGSATSRTPNAGLAVCVVNIIDIVPMTREHEEKACIEVYENARALITTDLRWLSRKFPVKGSLGVFNLDMPADVQIITPTPEDLNPANYPDYLKQYLYANRPNALSRQQR
ncbi:hypothetical protein [Spirosoma sordidisoli]|uniref:ASCH domain-containing protein n=1 Tax=Spirosoma sordidisoli TaxID=2502893 RepID=A0A4Q2UPE0_9BACT|nr:hypothetical protein [Spirosoma sordidisoli]RYC70752.1 hypothetical protein EQG79_00945 [Spirosoma sordidisoli]